MTNIPKAPVLIVEDEIFIRMIAVDALEDRGFSIIEAGDAREALNILEQSPQISLLFTDINMPGDIDGLDLAEEVARRWPHIEIIVTSGGVRLSADNVPDSGNFWPSPTRWIALSNSCKSNWRRPGRVVKNSIFS